jgi:hypothetical protein
VAAVRRAVQDQVVDHRRRRGGRPARPRPGTHQVGEPALVDPAGGVHRLAVVEDGLQSGVGGVDDVERRALQPRLGRIRTKRERQGGQLLADPGAALATARGGAGIDVAPLVRVARRGGPVCVDHQIRDGRRREQRLVPPGRQVDPGTRPIESPFQRVDGRGHVDVGEVAGVHPGPRGAAEVGRLAVDLDPPVRLVEAPAQPRRGAQEVRRHLVFGKAEHQSFVGPPAPEGRAQGRRELVEHRDGRACGVGGPVVTVFVRLDERARILGRFGAAAGGLGGPDQLTDLVDRRHRARDDSGAAALAAVEGRDHGHGPGAHLAVRGERVRCPAQVRLAVLARDDDAAVRRGGGERRLDELLWRAHTSPFPLSGAKSLEWCDISRHSTENAPLNRADRRGGAGRGLIGRPPFSCSGR